MITVSFPFVLKARRECGFSGHSLRAFFFYSFSGALFETHAIFT